MSAHLIITLAKVIIAAAWADGKIANEEINSLKDLLFRLPELNARQWAELEIYIETPVDADERARLIADLRAAVASPGQRDLALQTLEDLISADGVVTDDERRIADEIRAALLSADVSLFGQVGRLFGGAIDRRTQAAANRERYLDDFINNKVYYGVRRRLDMDENADLGIAEADLRKLSLIGGMLASVAHVNREVTAGEFDAIVTALETGWGANHTAATFVAAVATSLENANIDGFRLARQTMSALSPAEIERLVELLFVVAAADGMATDDEIHEIRQIAARLKLTNEQFIAAKLKIPRDQRQS
jgi:uncharacterized tellurite resistance protein B-like protein